MGQADGRTRMQIGTAFPHGWQEMTNGPFESWRRRGCYEGVRGRGIPGAETEANILSGDDLRVCVRRRREAARSGSFGSRPASSRRSGYLVGSPFGFASTKVIVNGGRPCASHTSCARSHNMLSAAARAALSLVASIVI